MKNNKLLKKKNKYITTLLFPENVKSGKIPSKFSIPTTVFKRKRQIEYTTNASGCISIQWSPQAFYLTNDGIFVFNAVGYAGATITASTSTGLGVDSTAFVPTGTPIRLVAASMSVNYGAGSSGGLMTAGSYETTIATNTADSNMSLFTNINSMKNVKTVRADSGIKAIYVPYDISCLEFYKMNTNLGKDGITGNGLLNTQRLVFYGNEMVVSSTVVQVTYTQIFEAVTSSDYFNPYATFFYWEPAECIKKYITNKGLSVMSLLNSYEIENDLSKEIKDLCTYQKDLTLNTTFYFPERIRKFRLPSIFGESTTLFNQNSVLNITTNSNGVFCLQWFPQFFHTTGNPSQSGVYLANNAGFDGVTGATPTAITNLDFSAFASPIFSNVRLVAASMKIIIISPNKNIGGKFLAGVNLEQPPFTTPIGTNYSYKTIHNLPIHNDYYTFDGLKVIYAPYDYSCFVFNPPDFLITANNNNAILGQAMYVCGYGLSKSTLNVKIIFDRVFEGIPSSYAGDYFATQQSKITLQDCTDLTEKIMENNLIITNLSDENKIIKLLK